MKYAHNVEARVFVKEGEDESVIRAALLSLFPFDHEKEKIMIDETITHSFESDIKILTVFIKKERQTKKMLTELFSKFSKEQKDMLHEQLESRLDKKLHFFIRLDKDKLMKGEQVITDSGNCFHLTIVVAAYPHKRAAAKTIIEALIDYDPKR